MRNRKDFRVGFPVGWVAQMEMPGEFGVVKPFDTGPARIAAIVLAGAEQNIVGGNSGDLIRWITKNLLDRLQCLAVTILAKRVRGTASCKIVLRASGNSDQPGNKNVIRFSLGGHGSSLPTGGIVFRQRAANDPPPFI